MEGSPGRKQRRLACWLFADSTRGFGDPTLLPSAPKVDRSPGAQKSPKPGRTWEIIVFW